MSHDYFIAMSYGALAAAIAVEVAVLLLRRAHARRRIEQERDLETTD